MEVDGQLPHLLRQLVVEGQRVLDALQIGQRLKSARCASYLREFRAGLQPAAGASAVRDFAEQAAASVLWRQATAREVLS